MRTRFRRRARALLLIPIFGGVFWVTALVASSLPSLLVLGVNVHGLGASYAGDPGVALAPLSQGILNDVSRDTGQGSVAAATPRPTASATAEPDSTASVVATTPPPFVGPTPAATPSPSPSRPVVPIPVPLPTVTPLPSVLPSPIPASTATPTPTPSPARAAIDGQVIDMATHLGIAAAQVTVNSGGSTTTDVNGNFSLAVNAGTYTLTASATGYTSASQSVSVDGGQTATVTIKLVSLTATGGIKGVVTNSVTAAAVVAALVSLSNGLTTITDLDGAFSFPVVPYGNYSVTASATGYVSHTQPVTVKAGHATTLDFALAP